MSFAHVTARSFHLRVCALLALGAFMGCRCGDGDADKRETEASLPTMPTGMLSPLPEGATPRPSSGSGPDRLAIARAQTSGEWVELQVQRGAGDDKARRALERWKPDSRFVSFDVMVLLHDPFAKALPGFDLFLPRLFEGSALTTLRTELTSMRAVVAGVTSLPSAKARFGEVSSLVRELADDSAWRAAQATLLATIDEIVAFAAELEKKSLGLWVLGS